MDPEDLRGGVSLAELLTSLKRRRPPTKPLLRRKFDALAALCGRHAPLTGGQRGRREARPAHPS
jgi:hypothetical protein